MTSDEEIDRWLRVKVAVLCHDYTDFPGLDHIEHMRGEVPTLHKGTHWQLPTIEFWLHAFIIAGCFLIGFAAAVWLGRQ